MPTLIVEDGTGLSNANSFVSVAEADAFFSNVGSASWAAASVDEKESALIRATAYLSTYFRWTGKRVKGRDQALAIPRSGMTDCDGNDVPSDEVPIELKIATYHGGSFELDTPNGLLPNITPNAQNKRVKVGPIEVEYRDVDAQTLGDADGVDDSRIVLTAIEDVLRCLVEGRIAVPYPVAV